MLGSLVMIHEFGHFIVAKLCGVKVNEFAIGMGPKLLKWRKGETLYTIRAFPVGGFCAMEGEDEGAPTPSALGGNADRPTESDEQGRSFANKPVWQRISIVVAGAAMNLLLGYVLLLVFNGALQEPYGESKEVLFGSTTIAAISQDSPAYNCGLRPGDTILEVNGRRVLLDTDLTMEMQNDADEKIALDNVAFTVVFDEATNRQYLKYDFSILGVRRTFLNTLTYSAKQELSVATIVWRTLVDLIRGNYGLNDLSGPVGTVDIIADAVGDAAGPNPLAGWRNLVYLMVMITVNLGVFNLLPLPALDGGRLIFLMWEGVTRKPVPQKYEAMVHFVGIVLLLLLMLFVTYSDVTRLFL